MSPDDDRRLGRHAMVRSRVGIGERSVPAMPPSQNGTPAAAAGQSVAPGQSGAATNPTSAADTGTGSAAVPPAPTIGRSGRHSAPDDPPARPAVPPTPVPRPSPHPAPNGRAPSPRVAPEAEPGAASADRDGVEDVWRLVARAQDGDREAFAAIYDRYFDLVFRYVYFRLGDRPTAEDFTSETFLRAYRRIGTISYQGRDVAAWLVTIARNIVLDHVKSSRYRLEITTSDLLDADRTQDGPEGAVIEGLTNAELLRCVTQLNAEQQECVVLRFLQGLSVAETAAIMGKKEGAIKALQHRAVRRLATLIPSELR